MSGQFWCEHKGGLGPPFPYCEICESKAARGEMSMNYEYAFVSDWETEDFIDVVNAYLKAGWALQGGISTAYVSLEGDKPYFVFSQALVHEVPDEIPGS